MFHWEQLVLDRDPLDPLFYTAFYMGAYGPDGKITEEKDAEGRITRSTYDEFGRSPKENEKFGTHHGWASSQFVAGGRVKGGLVGEAPKVVDVFALDGPPPVIDYRALHTTMIENWWGGSASGVFDRRYKPLDILKT